MSAIGRILPHRRRGKLRQIASNGEYEKKSSRFECTSSHLRAWFENHSLRQNIQHNGPSRPVVLCAPPPYPPSVAAFGQARSMGRNGCQIFWSAHLITASQSDPQARSSDDDVVHADTSALVDELRPGLVQNHSGFVIKSGGPTMTPHLAVNDAAP